MPAQTQAQPDSPPLARPERSWLPLLGLLVGVWAIIPPYFDTFGDLRVESRVEFADHVLPGVVVLAVAVLGFLQLRGPDPSQTLLFVGGGLIVLAGFWMVATHAPLIKQWQDERVLGGAVVWHGLPGVVVALLGVAWVIRFWGDVDEESSGS